MRTMAERLRGASGQSRVRRLGALLGGLGTLGLGGCGHDYWVRFTVLTDAAAGVVVDRDEIRIPQGQAVAVRVAPMRDDEELSATMEVSFESRRTDLLAVDETPRYREFIIFGSELGATTVDVYFGDDLADKLDASVVEAD